MMFKVLVTDPISDLGLQQLQDAPEVEVVKRTASSEEELLAIIDQYDALLVRSQTKVSSALLRAGARGRLRVIGRAGVGVDNIDIETATQLGIVVLHAPDGNTVTTSEHTFGLLLSLARHIPQAYQQTIAGRWERKSFIGVELQHKTLAIIGLGKIGIEVTKRALAFGMNVIGVDPFMNEAKAHSLGVTLGTLEEVLPVADFLSIHAPLTDQTHYLLEEQQFALMKRGIRIVNCARGGLIKETALLQALDDGIVAGAAIDVFEEEPPRADHPLFRHPKVIVTPHLGASTLEAQENVAAIVAKQLLHYLRQQPFKNAINMRYVSSELFTRLQPIYRLATRLGYALAQMTDGSIEEIMVEYKGEVATLDTSSILPYVVQGVLTHQLGRGQVTTVNAMYIADSRHIQVIERKPVRLDQTNSEITIHIKTSEEERWVTGNCPLGATGRLSHIGPYVVDLALEGTLLLISQQDTPGIIGKVGKVLGDHQINIATMQVGRQVVGGSAVMILKVDKKPEKAVIDKVCSLENVKRVREISFE